MRLTLAAVCRGRRVVLWRSVFKFAAVVIPLPALATGVIYKLATKFWSWYAVLLGLAAGAAIVLLVVIGALCTNLRKMPVLHDNRPSP